MSQIWNKGGVLNWMSKFWRKKSIRVLPYGISAGRRPKIFDFLCCECLFSMVKSTENDPKTLKIFRLRRGGKGLGLQYVFWSSLHQLSFILTSKFVCLRRSHSSKFQIYRRLSRSLHMHKTLFTVWNSITFDLRAATALSTHAQNVFLQCGWRAETWLHLIYERLRRSLRMRKTLLTNWIVEIVWEEKVRRRREKMKYKS